MLSGGWNAVQWLHLLAMAFFVGGQLFLVAAVVPVLRGGEDPAPMRAVARRYGYGTLIAIGVLIATGVPLAFHLELWSQSELHAKLTLVVAVAGLVIWHIRRPDLRALDGAIFVVSLAIVWLAVSLAH